VIKVGNTVNHMICNLSVSATIFCCQWLHTIGFNDDSDITRLYEKHNVIRFYISEDVSPENIYSHMVPQSDSACINCTHMYKWIQRL
jgi:hypothetical protein